MSDAVVGKIKSLLLWSIDSYGGRQEKKPQINGNCKVKCDTCLEKVKGKMIEDE